MHRMADFMRVPNLTKRSMREFFWERSWIPAEQLRRAGGHAWIEIDASKVARESAVLATTSC
jgi:hypothetical protein